MRIILYILIVVVAWMGLRHLISLLIGQDQCGILKRGQRLCHFVSLLILWASCAFSLYINAFWPLIVGFSFECLLRKAIIWSGQRMNSE